jgi:3'-5' exoribonuclease
VTSFQGALQVNVRRVRRTQEQEYDIRDYLPTSRFSIDDMMKELTGYITTIQNPYLKVLLESFFLKDMDFIKSFKEHSAAKSVHHGFVGGLLEHTLSVTKLCDFYCKRYPILNRDLLLTAAMCHDIGKTTELSLFPANDYTDEGQLLGHIVVGTEMIHDRIREIPNFPKTLANELKHCILAHHGELEYGSPKKPALAEAMALNLADNTDAKMETMTEIFAAAADTTEWLGYNRLFESNLRKTSK